MAERNTQPDTLVTDRATRWFVRLHSGNCSEIERQQFTEWYAESDTTSGSISE